jgi:hypothetical protein
MLILDRATTVLICSIFLSEGTFKGTPGSKTGISCIKTKIKRDRQYIYATKLGCVHVTVVAVEKQ